MLGFRRAIVHVALVALMLRAFLPAGWMPGEAGDAPLVMCSVTQVHDTSVPGSDSKDLSAKAGAGDQCAFGASPALGAPDNVIFFTPELENYDSYDEDTWPARDLSPAHKRPAPRAPPSFT